MKIRYKYTTATKGRFLFLAVPAFPEIVVRIEDEDISRDDLYTLAERAIRHALQTRLTYNDVVPDDVTHEGSNDWSSVQMTPLVIMKVLLHLECRERGWSKADLARKLEVTPTTATRLLDLFHESRSEVVTHAFRHLGKEIHTTIDLVQVD